MREKKDYPEWVVTALVIYLPFIMAAVVVGLIYLFIKL